MSDEYTINEESQQLTNYDDDNIKTLTGTEHIHVEHREPHFQVLVYLPLCHL